MVSKSCSNHNHRTNITSKSFLSMLSPTITQTSCTVPAIGDETAANIFIASRVTMAAGQMTLAFEGKGNPPAFFISTVC